MIPKECKRLAEVDFPIAVVSKHAAKEKSIRHGHPSTLHLWWARRPLAACRAMLLGLLLPDPADALCPADFKTTARTLLAKLVGKIGASATDLRAALLRFIGDFADWDNSGHPTYLEVGRGLVKAAHPDETPLILDPFAGGGTIPLEALRLGCDAFASDLNPVACLINKVMLEDIPRHGPELVEELRAAGLAIKLAAKEELAEFYPCDPGGARPIAYLWARTVRCESPNCGAEIPLVRSLWLCKKASSKRALRVKPVKPSKFGPQIPRIEFEVFEPRTEKEVPAGTVSRAKAICLCCGTVLPPERVRTQLTVQSGGGDVVFDARGQRTGGARLLVVITLHPQTTGRQYRLPTEADYAAVWKAQKRLKKIIAVPRSDGLSVIPDEPLPLMSGTFNAPLYGMNTWGSVFTKRQLVGMLWLIQTLVNQITSSSQVRDILGLALSRYSDIYNSLCQWESSKGGQVRHLFTRQAIPMLWDFAEGSILGEQAGDFSVTLETMINVVSRLLAINRFGQVQQADARSSSLPNESVSVYFTDPPYYFAVPYSDLSDFFVVWLRRVLPLHPFLNSSLASGDGTAPKDQELCEMSHWDKRRYAHKDKAYFETGMQIAFASGRNALREDGIGSVVFAHKTTEGWEALLSGMIKGGWTITGSWPISTEMTTRLRARDSAALATSVHLVCRPRPEDASIGDWSLVLRELPRRVADWMQRLQDEGVRGADLVFACIGPALEIYSRYAKVVDAEEREIPLGGDPEAREAHLRGFLAYVWEVVGRAALEQVLGTAESRARNGAAGALEEDARLTALFLWTLQSTTPDTPADTAEDAEEPEEDEEEAASAKKKKKGLTLPFDVARRFAQPLGIHLDAWEGRCIVTEKGVVRLIPVLERAQTLFGIEGTSAAADRVEAAPRGPVQQSLFPELDEPQAPTVRGRRRRGAANVPDTAPMRQHAATTLDRVHAAMLLQSAGRANALRALLKSETERGPDFLRLANALSALYPTGSDEKRLLDAMLLAVPR